MTETAEPGDRHASWLELFFDLVVVVAVNQLAHLLHGDAHHGPGGLEITTFFVLYLAIWLVWTTFMLYSNVVADRVRVRSMFLGMAGIAMMAAAVPHGMDERAAVFVAAYLATNAIGTGAFGRSGQVLLSWGAATRNAGLLPWIISFWADHPWVKLSLWSLGLAMTLWFSVLSGRGDSREMVDRLNERLARRARARERTALVVAQVDPRHLGERLGLFVIIVLGEAMLQLVGAVSAIEDWSPGGGVGWLLLLTATAGFGLLITLWALNVRHGFAEETRYPPAVVLPAHFLAIAAITTVAAGLGSAATAFDGHLPASTAWLLCAGVSGYLLVVTALTRASRRWPVSATAVALPLAVAALAGLVPGAVVVCALLAVSAGQLWNLRGTLTSTA
ncbi:MAG TPA: low temperature requirement protein A [Actinophytocola sp.]|nr:low temperature requirement protein A [Actinophytocola sp.]